MTAAAKDLNTLAAVKRQIREITDTTYDTLVQELITAASDAIEKYCRRSFYSRTIEELYSGPADTIILREYPVQAVLSLRSNPQEVLRINNSSSSNQRALAEITSTGLRLTRIASGVETVTTSVTFASYATLSTLAAAVTALGNGWEGTAVSPFGDYASADLYIPPNLGDGVRSQGALNAKSGANLLLHVEDLADFTWTPNGIIERIFSSWDYPCGFPGGSSFYRVKYTAGYTTIPEAVQEACALWVSGLFELSQRDEQASSVSSAPSGGTATYATFNMSEMPPRVKGLLAPFRRYRV